MPPPPPPPASMHQLSNGLLVSGPPASPRDRPRMGPPSFSGSASSRSHSGPTSKIPATGLITSGPPPSRHTSGQLPDADGQHPHSQPTIAIKKSKNKEKERKPSSVGQEVGIRSGFRIPPAGLWVGAVAFLVGLGLGVFVWVAAGKPVILLAVAALLAPAAAVWLWNWWRARSELERFFRSLADSDVDPRNLPVGDIVKITGVYAANLVGLIVQLVTCGAAPLETSYQNIPRCVYVSTELYEYRGWKGSSNHRRFRWNLRHSERHVSDFYISDLKSGTRFLVRTGSGARVASFVKPATIVDMSKKNRELAPTFLNWLTDRNLSSDDRVLCLEEGYIREGGIASVMGILRKHESLIIIDQPRDVISTGCQWKRCFFPMFVDGLILIGDATPEAEVCHV